MEIPGNYGTFMHAFCVMALKTLITVYLMELTWAIRAAKPYVVP